MQHLVHDMTLGLGGGGGGGYVEETTRHLGLMSSTVSLLLLHKPNPRPSNLPASERSDPPARCLRLQYHSKHVVGVCTPLPPPAAMINGQMRLHMAELEKELGLGLGATPGVIIGRHTYLPRSSFGRGPTGRDPESRAQRNHW